MKLLIVDDQRSIHLYLQKAIDLAALGFNEVLHAESGMQALDILRSDRPEVMILDIQMPDMNGIALLEIIRKEKIAHPETIVLSAYDEFLYAKRCIDFGVYRYVLKPIDPEELTRILGEVYQAVYVRRLDGYRWSFPLFCSHLNDDFDVSTLPVNRIEPLLYGVICINGKEDDYPAVKALEPVSHSTLNGLTMLLISVPSQKIWERTILILSEAFAAEKLPAGVSDLRRCPSEMASAAKEAMQRLWQSFYVCSVRSDASVPLFGACQDELRSIVDCFLQRDTVQLSEMVEHAFLRFSKDNTDPDAVFGACRKLLIRLCIDHCGEDALDLNNWPGIEGFITANQLQEILIEDLLALRQRIIPVTTHSDAETINRVRTYVDEHFSEDLSLSVIAEKFYISRSHVSRLFKQTFGENYQDYVLSVRMKAAAHLLTHSNARLYEISSAVGFEEPSYFSTVFKKTYGLSPRAYRLAEKEDSND